MVDAVEGCTEVQHTEEGDFTFVSGSINIRQDFEDGRLRGVLRSVGGLMVRQEMIGGQVLTELEINTAFNNFGHKR